LFALSFFFPQFVFGWCSI